MRTLATAQTYFLPSFRRIFANTAFESPLSSPLPTSCPPFLPPPQLVNDDPDHLHGWGPTFEAQVDAGFAAADRGEASRGEAGDTLGRQG